MIDRSDAAVCAHQSPEGDTTAHAEVILAAPNRISVVPVRTNGRIQEWAIRRGGFDIGFSATHGRAMYLAQKVAQGRTQV